MLNANRRADGPQDGTMSVVDLPMVEPHADPLAQRPRGISVAARRRWWATATAALSAVAVCLPYPAWRNTESIEWGDLLLLRDFVLASLGVMAAGVVLLALGRTRPVAGAGRPRSAAPSSERSC